MKYWRGFLFAAIFAAITWGLHWFASANRVLIDMVYPYVTRLILSTLADGTAGVGICLWQLFLFLLIAGGITLIVFAILRRWNPWRVTGWFLAVIMLFTLLNTGVYGLNRYAGPISEDIRLTITGYTVNDLEETAKFFLDKANALAPQVNRDRSGNVEFSDFDTLAEQAGDGFTTLTYEEGLSIFAGSTVPVKKLGMSWLYSIFDVGGTMVPLTGEAAVNTNLDDLALPFVMCQQMAKRMSIVKEVDSCLAAFMACTANKSAEFQYSGYFIAYRYCYIALEKVSDVSHLDQLACSELRQDLENFDDKGIPEFEENKLSSVRQESVADYTSITDCLVSWYIQEYILPLQVEEETKFDPLDETQVDLSDWIKKRS